MLRKFLRTEVWLLALGAATLGSPQLAAAQSGGTVSGRVVESSSQRPIADAQVTVVGTDRAAITNGNGEYTISGVPAGAQRLRIRRIGFAPSDRTVTVESGQTASVDFNINPTATDLAAVVVTGTAGPVEKRTIGNAITQLDVGRITEQSSMSTVSDVLQSKTPGVSLIPGSGAPGTAADIRIRGTSSISANNRPIFYVDGIRYNDGPLGSYGPSGAGITGNAFSQGTSALDAINPEDIERIEVIKGPAASTLYGADAAGGVIQIITKKGARGQKANFTVKNEYGNTDWGLPTPINYTTCTPARIAQVQTDGTPTWPGCQGQPAGTVLTDNPLRRDTTALRTGHYMNQNLAVRGGGETFNYYVSGDRTLDQGVLRNSFNNRKSARGNFTVTLSPKLDISLNASFLQTQNRLPLSDDAAGGLIISAIRGMPGRFVNQAYGFALSSPTNANSYDNQTKADRTVIGTTANYAPFSWLKNRITVGLDVNNPLATVYYAPGSADFPSGFLAQNAPVTHLYTFDYTGTISNEWRNLTSAFSVGAQGNKSNTRRVEATGAGFPSPDFLTIGASATTVSGSSNFSEQASLGYFFQEMVGFANRLFVTGAVRIDDNSAFGRNFTRVFYPKASLAYVISEEPALTRFFEAARADNFKLRLAYGQAGHAPGPYDALRTYTGTKVINGNNSASSALIPSAPGNADLHAEKGVETEGGFDASFLQGRVGVEFTHYNKRTIDALLLIPNAPSTGFTNSRYVNFGSLVNTGNEFGLNLRPIDRNNFAWDARYTYSTNNNNLTKLKYLGLSSIEIFDPYLPVNAQRIIENYPVGGWWGIDAKRNADGSFLLSPAGALQLDTLSYVGPSTPTHEGSFSSTFTIMKNLRLYGLIDFKGGNFILNQKERNRIQTQLNGKAINDGTIATAIDSSYYRNTSITRPWIQPADFVKLRDVSIAFDLPTPFSAAMRVNRATLTVKGHNLRILSTKYDGLDPEVNFIGNSTFLAGSSNFLQFLRVDSYTLPMQRRWTAALNLNF
ncbi:MAG TPA: SusC/RagA family TonB-linked outer membrane protein [Gemmatimonadaceae bacterium]|nr:SusC/RagA family TonB-linked outer membrane protein [Gemmatimonadaceae bacterium]